MFTVLLNVPPSEAFSQNYKNYKKLSNLYLSAILLDNITAVLVNFGGIMPHFCKVKVPFTSK